MITIFSTPTCPYCKMAKVYFGEKGVKYEEKDVQNNEKYLHEMVEKTHQSGVPVIEIGGKIIIGFDQEAIEEELKKSHE